MGVRGAALRGVVFSAAPGAKLRVYLLPFLLSCNSQNIQKRDACSQTWVTRKCNRKGLQLIVHMMFYLFRAIACSQKQVACITSDFD